MAEPPSGPAPKGSRPELPTLQEHMSRIQSYLRGCGLLAFPGETPVRHELARFMEKHSDETARIWADTIGPAFDIDDEELEFLAKDMREAQERWLAHICDPHDVETYEVLREHARGGFIAEHPPSRFLASQLKIRQILADLLRREMRDNFALPELLSLLDQALWERVLHITDFFVEARLSERRRLELQLIQSEKMAAIGQLAAGIAHEIRNPLGIIMNALYDLAELLPDASAEVEEDLQIARAEMGRVQEIINNLLEFSRDSTTEMQSVDLNRLVTQTLKLMNKHFQNSGVQPETCFADVGRCRASENGMRQVLLNLITNAVQAMPHGGELRIETYRRSNGRVVLAISDTGIGIPEEHLGRIFDPFYTTKDPGEGTGLGLSVVHSVIANAGGTLDVRSTAGSGTTFSIELGADESKAPNGSAS
ncbi:MAG: ATP-binding protein [Candidatus Binatia bacterium]|nr:ATP-binding protein [Candidatus Binatia bacterium]